MVMMGLLEVGCGNSSLAHFLAGVENGAADAASRLSAPAVRNLFLTLPCPLSFLPTQWTQVPPPASALRLIAEVLGDFTPEKH
jgi:hypothetical protein